MFNNNEKVIIKIDLRTLDIIIKYIFSDSDQITRSNLANIKMFMNMIDFSKFKSEPQLLARYQFIVSSLEARLDNHMENKDYIINYATQGQYMEIIKTSILPIIENQGFIRKSEIEYVNNFISQKLEYMYIYRYKDTIIDIYEALENGDLAENVINERFKEIFAKMQNAMRAVNSNKEKNIRFDLTKNFSTAVHQSMAEMKSPKNKLNTGYYYLNEATAGGFEAGRTYCFMGLTGGFKSGILVNLMYNIKLYNKHKSKDGRRPCIYMVTMENDITETIERIFAMSVSGEDIREFDTNEVMAKLKEDGRLTVDCEDDIDIVVDYVPNRSISTANLYDRISDLEDEGYEVIALFQDYIKRIRSIENHTETRLELAAIVDEFKVLAMHKKIPVITAAQLNRDGARKIDAAMEGAKTDLARTLGRENIGESWAMLENLDAAFIVNKEFHLGKKQTFLTFKRIKIRYGKSELTYFCQPFDLNMGFRVLSDAELEKPLGIETMKIEMTDLEVASKANSTLLNRGRASAITREEVNTTTNVSDVEPKSFSSTLRSA